MENPYNVLGVPEGASDAEIKKAYKNFAKELHPDRTQGDQAKEAKFKEIKSAYERIKNQEARDEYRKEEAAKQYARQGFHKDNPFGDGQGFNFRTSDMDEDILNEIFGKFGMGGGFSQRSGGFGARGHEREDQTATVSLDFWEAAKGGEKTFSLPDGSAINIKVPAGLKDGQKIRLKGQARRLNPGAQGDLFLKAQVRPHPKASFVNERDIQIDQELPVDKAVKGGDLLIKTPIGNFQISIPPYTDNGSKFRIKGKAPKGGDLLIKTVLTLPKDKKKQLQELFNQASL